MKKKTSFALVFAKYIKPILIVFGVVAAVVAIILICELYQYLAVNVWIPPVS